MITTITNGELIQEALKDIQDCLSKAKENRRCEDCEKLMTWQDYCVNGKEFRDMSLCSSCLIQAMRNIVAYEEEKEKWHQDLHRTQSMKLS